jgi:hypothetical protein
VVVAANSIHSLQQAEREEMDDFNRALACAIEVVAGFRAGGA